MANEKRLIDANYFVNKGIRNCPIEEGGIPLRDFHQHQKILALYPTVDAVEVVHGHWGKTEVEAGDPYDGNSVFCFDVFQCSECGGCFDVSDAFNYCPNCGAKMDGEAV